MAESILFGIADSIIQSLTSTAVKEIVSIWGAKKELSGLEKTISTIRAVLLDAEDQQDHNNQVRSWLKDLEDAVYEADDLSDDISTEALRRQLTPGHNMMKEVRTFFSSSNQLLFRCNMAHKIKDINDRLAAISENRRNFQLEVRREETRAREQTHSYIPEKEVIGRESDRKAILDLLLDPKVEENVSVLPIVGLGGLGKTTLAQFVFNHEKVRTNFDLKMWVCVSENFDVKSLVERIFISATKKSTEKKEMDQLQRELRDAINGKRYFLVLDDVWNEDREEWLKLKYLLSNGAKGSRIMITTRSQVVGKITTSTMKPYMLGILDKDNSWSLFKNVAFKPGQEPNNSNTVKTAMEIVDKCGGIPLAIRTIGSMLYSKDPETEWSSFLEMEFSKISQDENGILPTLKLSYDNLPSNLKHCFAYCSIFPKDHAIVVEHLIKLWMAQGFIRSSSSVQSLEEVGYEYFNELHWRSFFQEVKENHRTGKLECKMHDLMHDLAVKVSGSKCAALRSSGEHIDERTRHVSFDLNSFDPSGQIPKFLSKENRIRTILLPQQSPHSNKLSWDVVLGLKVLRTLDLSRSRLKTVPNSIGKLKHLRYLDLSWNREIKTLPNSITKLQNLQTLKLSDCFNLVELPRDLKKLVNLKHLENDGCYYLTHMPRGLGQLTNLQTLREFVLKADIGSTRTKRPHNGHEFSGGLNELMELNNLRGRLTIKNLRDGEDASAEYKDAKLNEKQHLHHLKLYWSDDDTVDATTEAADYEITLESLQPHPNLKSLYISGYRGVRLASWFSSLTTLDTLVLERCEKIENVSPLCQLPCLKSLELNGLYSLEYISDSNVKSDLLTSPTTIPLLSTLESLELVWLPKLKGWWKDDLGEKEEEDDDDASSCTCEEEEEEDIPPLFQCLSNLKIKSCPKLTSNMPLYPYLEGGLKLTDNNSLIKTFQRTLQMKMKMKMKNSFSPLSKLTSVDIRGIESVESLPEELISLTSLKDLSISWCSNLKYLSPAIQHLTSLQQLTISSCEEADIYDSDGNMWQALQSSLRDLKFLGLPQLETLPAGLQQLTSLHQLTLRNCNSLVGIPEWIGKLKSLQQLHIDGCVKLTSLPKGMRRLTSLQKLHIMGCPISNDDGNMWQGLDQSLRYLCFDDLPQLETLPAGLQQLTSLQQLTLKDRKSLVGIPEWIGNLKSLQLLHIDGCDKLTSLPEGMRQLTSLQVLEITDCPIYNGDGNMWQGLDQSLRSLQFKDLPQLETLPAGLQQLTALQSLNLSSCKSLVGIPEWIGNLKSLQQLQIYGCVKLTSLPEGMRQLTSLRGLTIFNCPILKQRCERETGEDWHKVAHIPYLDIQEWNIGPRQPSTSSSAARGKIFKCFRRLKLCNK